jgi:hypothetical protein
MINLWIPVDTLYGLNNTFWTDYENDPIPQSTDIELQFWDSCLNSIPHVTAQRNMANYVEPMTVCGRKHFFHGTLENITGEVGKVCNLLYG